MKLKSFKEFQNKNINEMNIKKIATTAAITGSLFTGHQAKAENIPLKNPNSYKTSLLQKSVIPNNILSVNRNLSASENAFILIRHFEGFYPEAYEDEGGTVTLGYGTVDGVKIGDTITKPEAERRMREEVKKKEKSIIKNIQVPLTQDQFDALVSFSYNMGTGPLKTSTFSKYLNNKKYKEAINEFPRWINIKGKPSFGLLRRRKSEMILFETGKIVLTHTQKNATQTTPIKKSNYNKKWITKKYGSDNL